jgi:hypothetical protein
MIGKWELKLVILSLEIFMTKRKMDEQLDDPGRTLLEKDKKIFYIATKQGYLIQNGSKWGKLKSAFYKWCELSQRTFICVEQSKFTSTIHVDGYVQELNRPISELAYERFVQIAVRYLDPYGPGDFLINIRNVPNDEVEKIAQEIVEIYTEQEDENNISSYFSSEIIIEKALAERKKWAKVSNKTGDKIRDKNVVIKVRKRSQGVCELCNRNAPFKDQLGNPYLEVHHVVWISRGGEDTVENAVALCPNCHRKMHILDFPKDRAYLGQLAKTQKIFEE